MHTKTTLTQVDRAASLQNVPWWLLWDLLLKSKYQIRKSTAYDRLRGAEDSSQLVERHSFLQALSEQSWEAPVPCDADSFLCKSQPALGISIWQRQLRSAQIKGLERDTVAICTLCFSNRFSVSSKLQWFVTRKSDPTRRSLDSMYDFRSAVSTTSRMRSCSSISSSWSWWL